MAAPVPPPPHKRPQMRHSLSRAELDEIRQEEEKLSQLRTGRQNLMVALNSEITQACLDLCPAPSPDAKTAVYMEDLRCFKNCTDLYLKAREFLRDKYATVQESAFKKEQAGHVAALEAHADKQLRKKEP